MEKGDISKIAKQVAKEVGTDVKRQMGAYKEEMKKYVDVALNQVAGIGEKVENISEKVDNLAMDMLEVKSKLTRLQLDVSADLDRKVDKKHFVDLELRMRKLEKK